MKELTAVTPPTSAADVYKLLIRSRMERPRSICTCFSQRTSVSSWVRLSEHSRQCLVKQQGHNVGC